VVLYKETERKRIFTAVSDRENPPQATPLRAAAMRQVSRSGLGARFPFLLV
jgi:hypothetical protein